MEERISHMERSIKRLKFLSIALCCSVLLLLGFVFLYSSPSGDILRVRGLIIEDGAGRERILIGAPIPEATNRVRTNSDRVRDAWSDRYPDPDAYMESYQEYNHVTNGILILNEEGFDQIALGDPVPDPNIGPRIGPQSGMIINDEEGFERSGYGLLQVEGRQRVVLGMDTDRSEEGVMLFLMDSGPAGVAVLDGDQSLFLGSAPANHSLTGLSEPMHGLLIRDETTTELVGGAP